MDIKDLKSEIRKAIRELGVTEEKEIEFEIPKNPEHGDLSTNIAMQLARILRNSPRNIAADIKDKLSTDEKYIKSVEIAGAGFINFRFTNYYYTSSLQTLTEIGESIGSSNSGAGKKVNVEYVSVNPTGLLHLGHGRNAVIGDTISNLYEWCGYEVTREYYFNNAGNQMNVLAQSIYARYRQQLDQPDFPFPENGYHGDYIKTIAAEIIENHGEKYIPESDEKLNDILPELKKYGEKWAFDKITKTLERMNIVQDIFYNEDSLYSEGKIEEVINDLKSKDLVYEKDGALWLKLTELGQDDDRVIVKSSGEPTYRLPDIAYHREKFRRGFDILIDIFGADHIATVPDVLAGVKALGYDPDLVKVLIHQFVTLTEHGEQVKMSKRTGRSYTLDELLDEVGADVVRFFLLMRSISTHLEFDLALAREQSDKNPVFYLQYAHARLCSIFEKAREREIEIKENSDLNILTHKTETDLIKMLLRFDESIETARDKGEPHILAEYLRELAQAFHIFYHECRIIGSEESLMQARFKLARIVRITMRNGLKVLGVSAPEKM